MSRAKPASAESLDGRLGGEQQGQRDARRQDGRDGEQQERPVLPGGGGAIFAGRRFDAGILLPERGGVRHPVDLA